MFYEQTVFVIVHDIIAILFRWKKWLFNYSNFKHTMDSHMDSENGIGRNIH